MVLCDDSNFVSADIKNFLWVTFTRSNPSHDIYGVDAFIRHKHWGCKENLIIDARKKPFHAPELIPNESIEAKVDRLFQPGGSLYGIK